MSNVCRKGCSFHFNTQTRFKEGEIINTALLDHCMKLSQCICSMMAQHVIYSSTPAALLLLVFTISNLVNGNAFTEVKVSDNLKVKSVNALITKQSHARENLSVGPGFLVEILGTGLESNVSLRWSSTPDDCDPNNKLDAILIARNGSRAIYKFIRIPNFKVTTIYFCLRTVSRFGETWTNLGSNLSIKHPVQSE